MPLDPEQEKLLGDLPDRLREGLLVWGTNDHNVLQGAANTAFLGGYYYETVHAPTMCRLKLWHLQARRTVMDVGGVTTEVQIHPSIDGRAGRPNRAPDYDHTVTYRKSRYAGTVLAVHAVLWMMAEARRERQGGDDA